MSLIACFTLVIPLGFPILHADTQRAADAPESEANRNPLEFMAGTWRSAGLQEWPDGSMVEHRGIVEGVLSTDGLTLTRTFWAAFGNGHSLGGRSVHVFDPAAGTWSSQWYPTLGTWNATPALGRMEGEAGVEIGRGVDAVGPFTSQTKIFDIRADSYRVRTNVFYDSGRVSEDNWTIRFERVQEEPRGEPVEHGGTLGFLLGDWLAEGTLLAPDGSKTAHQSFVRATRDDEGESVHREFWGALETGGALRGVSSHTPDGPGAWAVRWIPTGGAANAQASAMGTFDGDGFVEVQEQGVPEGTARVITRYYDIRDNGYSVRTDVESPGGEVVRGVWSVHFRRIG